MSNVLNFGIPKGSLEEATVALFKKAGWQISISSRSYFPGVDDAEMNCKLIRPQEMGRYVEETPLMPALPVVTGSARTRPMSLKSVKWSTPRCRGDRPAGCWWLTATPR